MDRRPGSGGGAVDTERTDRGVAVLSRGDRTIGLVEIDAATTARPDAVELVATAAGLRMETERLLASARGDVERTRLLASRLLSAVDAPRASLRRLLVDGPLTDLANVASDLSGPVRRRCRKLPIAWSAITTRSGRSPRSVSAALTADGLAGAINRPGTPQVRFPEEVEITAYLAVEPDPDATISLLGGDARSGLRISTEGLPNLLCWTVFRLWTVQWCEPTRTGSSVFRPEADRWRRPPCWPGSDLDPVTEDLGALRAGLIERYGGRATQHRGVALFAGASAALQAAVGLQRLGLGPSIAVGVLEIDNNDQVEHSAQADSIIALAGQGRGR